MLVDSTSEVGRSADLTKSVQLHGRARVLGVVTVGLILRLEDFLGWWLNPDEGIYFSTVTQPSRQAFCAEVGSQAHPPLYFLILRWVRYLTQDSAALRLLAPASGVGAPDGDRTIGRACSARRRKMPRPAVRPRS